MFTLQILHASDLEGGIDAIDNAPNFAAVLDTLETDAGNLGIGSIFVSAGDNYIPGPFFNAGGDFSLSATYEGFYNEFFGLIDTTVLDPLADTNDDGFFDNDEIEAQIDLGNVTFAQVYTTDVNSDGFADYFEEIDTNEGRVDVAIMNALGLDASAVGNHEFDAGTDAFENIINYDSEEGNSLSGGRYGTVNYLQEVDTPGVQFPYLSANLDFSGDFDVGALFTTGILPSTDFQSDLLSARDNPADPAATSSDSNDPKIAPATIIEVDGEQVGVVGATTQLIASISSPGNIDDVTSPGTNDMVALAAALQPVINQLISEGVNKIIVTSHLQQIALEQELAGLLSGVDVIISGGSDTLLADGQDSLRPGDTAAGDYPFETTNADGDPVVVVSTDGEYSYVGRLVVTFDDNGVVDLLSIDENVSGVFATDDQNVLDLTGEATIEDAIAASEVATDVENLAAAVTGIVTALDGDVAGETDVFLNGQRTSVRTEETNLGNLTADANLTAAQEFDSEVLVSLKNGGGIRAPIGEIVDNGDGTADLNPPAANPLSGKEEREISELDIDNTLRFDNGLVIVELTPEQLKIILEHGVAATADGATPGQFPQVGGIHFSFDPDGTSQVLGDAGSVVTEGTRVQNVSLIDEDGVPIQKIIVDGQVADDAPASVKVVTLDFLAGGGDGYPFAAFSDITDIGVGEQEALSNFLTENFPVDGDTAFADADTEAGRDARIQNLNERSDTVDAPIATQDLLFEKVAEFEGEGGSGASEVVAHEDGKLYVTNGEMDRIDIFHIPEPDSMADGVNNYGVKPILTVGETLSSTGALNDLNAPEAGYTPPGILDGLGAYELNESTVRVFANHELLNFRGNSYEVSDGLGGTFSMVGARISYFDIDKDTKQIVDSGLAYNTVVDANGDVANDTSFLAEGFGGFSRFCSGILHNADEFGAGTGITETIYFAGEEDGGNFNPIGGAEWALDVDTGAIYQIPAMGRGAWENITQVDTGTTTHVAFILSDDTSPFNADADADNEAAPLYMYVGEKDNSDPSDFLARNGLADGELYVWVPDDAATNSPAEFNGAGSALNGTWVEVDNSQDLSQASTDGSTGFDEFGYPTQSNLWSQAETAGAFQFSRPEDVATNPADGTEFVLASTGVDTFDVDPVTGNGVDTFGTVYTMQLDFTDLANPAGSLNVLYDGDEDPTRALRSPDNLDWADDGFIYVQEDEAEEDSLSGDEALFGEGAANPNEAGIVRLDPATGNTLRVANIDRSVLLDPTTSGTPVDQDAGAAGEWETSGILDVSTLFGEAPGSLFLFDVQAHGLDDQDDFNADSRLTDTDLAEGGQLSFLKAPQFIDLSGLDGYDGVQSVDIKNGIVAVAISRAPVEQMVFGETVMVSQPGFVALFDAETKQLLSTIDVGNLPDQLTFSEDGNTLVVAGEGEKNDDSDNDDNPLGTVALIDTTDPSNPVAELLDFTGFNGLEDLARDAGIRVQDGVSIAEDLEPEYAAISPDGTTAFVSLQENNAIAKIDLATGEVLDIFSLGTVDFSSESQLDANDNGVIEIQNFDNLVGFRMADAIATFEIDGMTYVATANEGDSRDFDEDRVGDLADDGLLDESIDITGLERLEVSTIDGDADGDGDIDVLHTFSSRSFSIFDENGNLMFDSGPDFEKIIAELAPERFNDDDGDDGEDRSDAKGPEPEAITIGQVEDKVYAFIGLERDSGIMVYDVTSPSEAFFVNYIPPLLVDDAADGETARHAPEVITFIPAEDSNSGNAQIAVAYEVSGTTVVYDLKPAAPLVTIPEIQGAEHISAYDGMQVRTTGIVTAVDFNGYYLQDPDGDGDTSTSDGIFVFTGTGSDSPVAVGDEVEIKGLVSEFIPGGAPTGNLSITQISASEAIILSSGNDLPDSTLVGITGYAVPTQIVISEIELPVDLQTDPGTFNPALDGIDFYESLEGMLITVDDPVAISATNGFNETWVVTDDGDFVTSPSGGLNDRGGLNLNANADGYGDLNPERIQIQYDAFLDLVPEGFTPPDITLGDNLSDITGVVSYSFGNFEVLVTEEFEIETPSSNTRETTAITSGDDMLTVATYNVLNVTSNPADGDADQIDMLATQIVANLGSPDILALQEIQDNSGVTNDGTLSADQTLQAIVDAIVAAGGPQYEFASAVVDVDGETGGIPGGNIRNAFLYDPTRVEMSDIVTLEVEELTDLGISDPTTFDGTRDPLLGTFVFNGQEITLINNHFTSRFGSEPVFGASQPFLQAGEAEREAEALAINEVVDALLADNENARIVVLGDLNTFEFTDELTEDLPGVGDEKVLTNLIDQLPDDEAYTFVFQGNSQVLDHVFVTDNLLDGAKVDVVHVNNDFTDFASDHEPVVASFRIEPEDLTLIGTRRRDDLEGGAGDDLILGLRGNDMLNGLAGDDDIFGGRGRDDIDGGDGNDFVSGGRGRDAINGGDGDDDLRGDRGNDEISGGLGNDMITGGRGNDLLIGDEGEDEFIFGNNSGRDTIVDFEIGSDLITLQGLDFANVDEVLDATRETSNGVVIRLDGGNDRVSLLGIDKDDLSDANISLVV